MFNYLTGSYKNRVLQTYNLKSPSLSPIIGPISGPPLIKLPDIHANHIQPVDCCVLCNIHRSQGCTNNIKKNGHKIWYVLHNLVESIKTPKLTNEEFDLMCTTIITIIKSIPCKECAGHSLFWYKTCVKNNTKLHSRIHFIYEVWKHHDDVTKRLLMVNPCIIVRRLTWNEYKKQMEINKITCSCSHLMNK